MDAITLLKNDHEKVSAIFEKLEPTTERALKTREELFAKLKAELDVHAHIEETIFYPAIKDAAETRAITLEGYEEHHVVKILLSELASMPVDTEQWTAKLKVLKENVEHHVEEEEDEMFKSVRKILTKEEINNLGARMEAEKLNQLEKISTAGA
ncbi:MAG: hemerythrin domain-containing protein [Acidobacteriota bacterium]|nr:hemerythrin domain-containing protein [Acidobacteriota bacterium]